MNSIDDFSGKFDSLLPLVLGQLRFAREYMSSLLVDVPDEEWFRMPLGVPTHLAWQVGHLAMAEYGLCLYRVRGRVSEDTELMPGSFRKAFSRGTTVEVDPGKYPAPAEIRATLARVRAQVEKEAPGFTQELLSAPSEMPYSVFPNKFGGMLFSPQHEMIHAGQIGVLRRAFGLAPIR
jgi:hypothetical protein